MARPSLSLAVLLPLAMAACAQNGAGTPQAASTAPAPMAQPASAPAAPDQTAGGPACLANPDFAKKPNDTHYARYEWAARANGRSCYWKRTRV